MTASLARRLTRAGAELLPSRLVHRMVSIREAVAPKPWPFDAAAVGLREAERSGRGPLPYPPYLYGLLTAARTAVAIGASGFTVMECGVAGGNGLLALERHAAFVTRRFGLTVTVLGFDSGAGLLPTTEPRDCGFALPPRAFAMDESALRRRLTTAELVIGLVEQTVGRYLADHDLPPIGFVAIDLDVYTGTKAVLDALPAEPERLLPRVPMYFDDLSGWPYTSEVAEWAAIRDFNAGGERKIGQVMQLAQTLGGAARVQNWPHQFFVLHVWDHPRYDARETVSADVDLGLRR